MYKIFFIECDKSITDLFDDFDGLNFTDLRMWLHILLQIAFVELFDDIVILSALHCVKIFDNIFRLEGLYDLNIVKERFF